MGVENFVDRYVKQCYNSNVSMGCTELLALAAVYVGCALLYGIISGASKMGKKNRKAAA